MGNISPGPNVALRATGATAWFGWPDDPKVEPLREAWFEAPDKQAQRRLCRRMQEEFWLTRPMFLSVCGYQPTAFRANLQDVRDGWPQLYGVRRVRARAENQVARRHEAS